MHVFLPLSLSFWLVCLLILLIHKHIIKVNWFICLHKQASCVAANKVINNNNFLLDGAHCSALSKQPPKNQAYADRWRRRMGNFSMASKQKAICWWLFWCLCGGCSADVYPTTFLSMKREECKWYHITIMIMIIMPFFFLYILYFCDAAADYDFTS